jgi:hypothetical protein
VPSGVFLLNTREQTGVSAGEILPGRIHGGFAMLEIKFLRQGVVDRLPLPVVILLLDALVEKAVRGRLLLPDWVDESDRLPGWLLLHDRCLGTRAVHRWFHLSATVRAAGAVPRRLLLRLGEPQRSGGVSGGNVLRKRIEATVGLP